MHQFVYFLEAKLDLRGLRLDWFRFQAYVSVNRSPFSLADNRKFAATMNTTVFHLKMIDLLEDMLRETSDLSVYWYLNFFIIVELYDLQLIAVSRSANKLVISNFCLFTIGEVNVANNDPVF